MKKTYAAPEVEVSAVSAQDILNSSAEVDAQLAADALIDAKTLFGALGY